MRTTSRTRTTCTYKGHRNLFRAKMRQHLSIAILLRHELFDCLIILSHKPIPATDGDVQVPRVWCIQLRGQAEVALLHVSLESWRRLHNKKAKNALLPASFNVE